MNNTKVILVGYTRKTITYNYTTAIWTQRPNRSVWFACGNVAVTTIKPYERIMYSRIMYSREEFCIHNTSLLGKKNTITHNNLVCATNLQ